jgi:cell division septal protein FtsQ
MRKIKRRVKTFRRKRKKSGFLSKFYFSILGGVIFLLVLAGSFVYLSSQFTVKDIKAAGLTGVSNDDLEKTIKDKLTFSFNFFGKQYTIENFLMPASQKLNSVLAAYPEIESINVERDYLQKSISFVVKEKQPSAIWEESFKNDSCFLIDKNGSFIKKCDENNIKGLLKINEKADVSSGNEIVRKNFLAATESILAASQKYALSGSNFSLLAGDKLAFDLSGGCCIYFNINDDLDWQLQKLGVVLKQSKYSNNLSRFEYIDLRFGNQAIIK